MHKQIINHLNNRAMKERQRFKVRTNIVGSSDFRRVKSARAILAENHERNLTFFATIKPVETSEKELTEDDILRMYSRVSIWGNWCPVRKFIGVLMFMYNENYKFE